MRRSPRLIIAAIIFVIGLVGYYSRTQVNPVTGEKQRVSLTADQEIAIGLNAAPQMAEQMGGLDPDPEVQADIAALGGKLVSSSMASGSPYQFQFHVLRDPDTVNAFALPGGPIFITRGLLNRLENEAQLAGVLGHEVGHVIARHAAEHIAKSELAQSVVAAVGVAGSDEYGRGQHAAAMAALAAQMVQLRYGRQDELESDKLGVNVMADAGYDPRELVQVMAILEQAGGGRSRQPEFMSSHPNPGNRQEQIRQAIAAKFPSGVPPGLTTGRRIALRR